MSEFNLANKAAELQAKMEKVNPANLPEPTKVERQRIPMTAAMRKLEVPEIPGYHIQWIRSDPSRVQQALRAGYEFVSNEEVGLNSFDLGGDAKNSGNTDMGSRVSVVDGSDVGSDGQVIRSYLMKQRKELHEEDEALIQAQNDRVVEALTAGLKAGRVGGPAPGETGEDTGHRYVDRSRTRIPKFFQKKAARP